MHMETAFRFCFHTNDHDELHSYTDLLWNHCINALLRSVTVDDSLIHNYVDIIHCAGYV
jgi:hypothetical protein